MKNKSDEDNCAEIIECLIDRSAKLVAANIAAVILKPTKGISRKTNIDYYRRTTFYKMHKLRSSFENTLTNI